MYTSTIVFLLATIAAKNVMGMVASPRSTPALHPAMPENFPDPSLIEVDGITYTFSTTSGGANVPVAKQLKGQAMEMKKTDAGKPFDVMPKLPKWSAGDIWAPDVIQLADGSFVLYFAGRPQNTNRHCVGAATSKTVTGPYTPIDTPLACPLGQGGAIDASGFVDTDGTLYVVYKIDGNSLSTGSNNGPCGNADGKHPTPLMLQQVKADGYTTVGKPVELLDRSAADGPLIEAPSLIKTKEGVYVLFFSSNCFLGPSYDTSYATSKSLKGPYTKTSTPLLSPGQYGLFSPGGTTASKDGSRIVFHADKVYSNSQIRLMYEHEIKISGTTVELVMG